MNEMVSLLVHSSNIVTGERLAIGFLLIVLVGMFAYRENRKSTKWLAVTIVIEIIHLLCDSVAFQYDIDGAGPLWLINTAYYVSYVFGYLTLLFFSYYVYFFIKEKTSVGRWIYIVPTILALVGIILVSAAIFQGKVYAPVDGTLTVIGYTPLAARLIQFALIIFHPLAALTKVKQIGLKSVLLLGLFGIIPGVVIFLNFDYSMMFTGYSLTVVYILLQSDTSAEKERQKKKLENLNKELQDANEEKLAQIEEISALNEQLEESASEQEAQIEEITSLNSELEERQALLEEQKQTLGEINDKLEKANEEQKHNISEINKLNELFKETQDNGIRYLLDQIIVKNNESEIELIDHLVCTVGQYFDADRAYVFERDITGQYTVNTFEWCREGVNPEIDNLQEVPVNVVDPWMAEFREKGSFYISCDDEYAKKEPIVYEVLEPQGIQSLMAAPMTVDGDIIGFVGVDNPRINTEHELYLSVAAAVVNHERLIIREKEQEEEYNIELKKSREAAEAANEAKTTFLFNMSHDIRTPMNAIIGFRDLLEKHQEEPEKRVDYLRKIEDASDVLLSIINNVLEMARIEKGTIELNEAPWSTEQFNSTIYSIFEEMMDSKGIEFVRDVEVNHPYVYCDPQKLRDVFINILSNAYKYTNPGGKVEMILKELPAERDGYVIYETTIRDNGIGMSEEFLPHIFEEFSREYNTTDNKIEGTGLGMPIVKRLLDLMGGKIEVQSEQGAGSTFIVTIEHRIAEKSDLFEHEEIKTDPSMFKGKRILLAEDNDLNAEIAYEILTEAGLVVERAEDGVICCEMISAESDGYYDLVLMDVQMPNMNGYEATKAIRNMEDHAKASIPIIAMTANAFEEDKREALRSGMNGHLAKPVNVSELMAALAEILSSKTK